MIDFQIAKDRRDGLLHATNISLCEESFIVSKEKRDKGSSRTVIFNVKEMFFFFNVMELVCLHNVQLFGGYTCSL